MLFSPELEQVVTREGTRQAVIKRLACPLDQGRTGAVGRTTALAAQEARPFGVLPGYQAKRAARRSLSQTRLLHLADSRQKK